MAKVAPPKKASKPAVPEVIDCPGCQALRNAYRDIPLAVLKQHCARHPVTDKAMTDNGLPPAGKGDPEPEDLPPKNLVFSWDGEIRTVWAAAGTCGPPESVAWEHLHDWVAALREEWPKLTARAVVNLYRGTKQWTNEGAARLRKLLAQELEAEKASWEQTGAAADRKRSAEERPPQPTGARSGSKPTTGSSTTSEGKDTFSDGEKGSRSPSSSAQPSPTAKPRSSSPAPTTATPQPSSKVPRQEGRDAFGYRLGTRSALVDAFLMANPGKWMTGKEVEAGSKATSVGSHLSSLVAAGWIEYKKGETGKAGLYRYVKKK